VIEDAAQAHGAEYKGRRVGMGDMGCFSFYPGKNLGAYGEGGMVTTNNEEYAQVIRMLRDWGQERKYHHVLKGFNYRMEGIQGAILRVKLRHLDAWTEARRRHAAYYDALLAGTGVQTSRWRSPTRATSITSTPSGCRTRRRCRRPCRPGRSRPASTTRSRCTCSPPLGGTLRQDLAGGLRREGLIELYGRFIQGQGPSTGSMRRILWLALTRSCGSGLRIEPGVASSTRRPSRSATTSSSAARPFIQGRFDGRCRIGNHVWIGPQSYLDARDLVLGDHVGWGPGAKVLGSAHSGQPAEVPIIETDLVIKPVRVEDWADIGTGAILLPGVTVGQGAPSSVPGR
jgi:acetyltransferase-like isoleucine patch superfamily enzyme